MIKKILKSLPLALLIALIVWARQSGFFEQLAGVLRGLGIWAMPAFFCVYVLSCLLFFPSVVMTCMAGAIFPLPAAIVLSLLGAACGSTVALLIGRYGMRPWMEKKSIQYPVLIQFDEAIRKEGWKIIALARLTPVFPFSIGNYLFGATAIDARAYALAAFLGSIPSAAVYALAGRMAGGTGDHVRTPAEWVLLAAGILATVFLSWYLKRIFDRILNAAARSSTIKQV